MTPNKQTNNRTQHIKTIASAADSIAKCTMYKHRDRAITKFMIGP